MATFTCADTGDYLRDGYSMEYLADNKNPSLPVRGADQNLLKCGDSSALHLRAQ